MYLGTSPRSVLSLTSSAACTWRPQRQIVWWLFPVSIMYWLPVLSLVRQFLFTTVPWGTCGYQPPQGPGGNWPQVKAVGIEPGHDFQSIVWGFWKEQSSLVAISDMVLPVIVTEESAMPSVLCPQPVLSKEV